jgi:hypothetical protein
MKTIDVLRNVFLFFLMFLTFPGKAQDFGRVCNVDLNIECERPVNYLNIVIGGPKWSPASYVDRYVLYNSTDVQGSVDGCNLFAMLLKTECAIQEPVNVVFHSNVNAPIAVSVVDGFDKDIPCRGFLPNEFKG